MIGVAGSFERLPPPKSDRPQSGLEQVVHALDSKNPPKQQPTPTNQSKSR